MPMPSKAQQAAMYQAGMPPPRGFLWGFYLRPQCARVGEEACEEGAGATQANPPHVLHPGLLQGSSPSQGPPVGLLRGQEAA